MRKITKILLVLLVVLAFSAMAIASGSDTGAQKVGEVGTSTAETSEQGAAEVSEPEKAPSPQEETAAPPPSELHVGDTFEADGMKIVYIASGEYVSDNEFLQPAEGNRYIFIRLYCENTGTGDTTVSSYSFECYADGYNASSFYGGGEELSATLSPGRSTIGSVYYEVPANASSVEIEYELNAFTEEKLTFLYEGNLDSGFVPEGNTTATEDAFAVGDIVDIGGAKISYLSCELFESDNPYTQPAEGYCFVSLVFDIENTSDSDLYITSFSFDCFADGASCSGCYIRDDDLSATLSPGRKANGTVTFEVPVTASVIEVEYLENYWTSNRVIFRVK